MNQGFWENRTVQFAVGVTVIFLLVRWLLTGDLLLLAEAARAVEDGETKSVSIWGVVWPMIFEAGVIVGASTIAFAVGLWGKLAELFAGIRDQAAPAVSRTSEVSGSGQQLAISFARAAASNDTAEMELLRGAIRKPYALAELKQAVSSGDSAKVDALVKELKGLMNRAANPRL